VFILIIQWETDQEGITIFIHNKKKIIVPQKLIIFSSL